MSDNAEEILIVEQSEGKAKSRSRDRKIKLLDRDARILKAYNKRVMNEALGSLGQSVQRSRTRSSPSNECKKSPASS